MGFLYIKDGKLKCMTSLAWVNTPMLKFKDKWWCVMVSCGYFNLESKKWCNDPNFKTNTHVVTDKHDKYIAAMPAQAHAILEYVKFYESSLSRQDDLSAFSQNRIPPVDKLRTGDYEVQMIDGMVFGEEFGGHPDNMIFTISNHPDYKRFVKFSRAYMPSGTGPSLTLQYMRDQLGNINP